MAETAYVIHPIGWVESPLVDPDAAPLQGDEGTPDAWLVLTPTMRPAMQDLAIGAEVIVLTWLDRADRDALVVHPRGDRSRPPRGVFGTRSQDRPNPIGLHPVRVITIEDTRIRVSNLEAVDGTPVVDIKPVLGPVGER
ncbi:MAG TPA: tRNA (N6-threonylcarbamoyladenosine(37)-N6)-methyltransferase TrmO [Acidimicrobiia bacterium]|jgi:tRNA-Thr(GGU) m(6)t(6)A37 methyltransferase TsaA